MRVCHQTKSRVIYCVQVRDRDVVGAAGSESTWRELRDLAPSSRIEVRPDVFLQLTDGIEWNLLICNMAMSTTRYFYKSKCSALAPLPLSSLPAFSSGVGDSHHGRWRR